MASQQGVSAARNAVAIDALFATLDQCVLPGAGVGVAIAGRPVYRRAFGLANMDAPLVLTPSTRMNIGSTTKHFTCLAYMLLCEGGRASPDDLVATHLPELSATARGVTMRHLMSHVSGLRDVHDICYQFSGSDHRKVSALDVLRVYAGMNDVNFEPGANWVYNNGGYSLLGLAVERIAGHPLEDVLRTRIFEPAGMCDTLLRRWQSDFVANSACLHMARDGGGFEKSHPAMAGAGQGGMMSTVDDMLRWLGQLDNPIVGSPATWAAMRDPYRLANGVASGYGLGLINGRYRGLDVLHHGGTVLGGNAQMLKVPAAGLDVVVIVNRHDISAVALGNKLIDVCIANLEPVQSQADSAIATGTYFSARTGRVVELRTSSTNLWAKHGRQIASIDFADIPVEPDASGVLRPVGEGSFQLFALTLHGDRHAPSSITLSECGNVDTLTRVTAGNRNLKVDGRYNSAATGTVLNIADNGSRLESQGQFGAATFRLEHLGGRVWRATSISPSQPWGFAVVQRDDDAALSISTYRNRGLVFERCS